MISGVVWDISGISAVSCGISAGGAAGDQRVSCGRSSASLMLLLCGIAPPHHLNITDRRRPLTASLFFVIKAGVPEACVCSACINTTVSRLSFAGKCSLPSP